MNRFTLFVLAAPALLGFWSAARAELVVNEVLSNEPGNRTTLEWIEVVNYSATATSLGEYQLQVGTELFDMSGDVTLEANEYFMICRRLYAWGSSPGFESYWGDSSGVWGDTAYEDSLKEPYQISFSLRNDSGSVTLLHNGTPVSSLSWSESGRDGHSWERITPDLAAVSQSMDADGSTPGYVNSLTPVPSDLALEDIRVANEDGFTCITFTVVNRGLNAVSGARLFLVLNDSLFVKWASDTTDIIDIPLLTAGDTAKLARQYLFEGLYLSMTAFLSDDDRNGNNAREFVAIGGAYPPVILSELMANPRAGLNTEWVEIKNRSDRAIDISGWMFGDEVHLYQICSDSLPVQPDEYIILTRSTADFLDFCLDFSQRCFQPSNWPVFNNDGDIVRLVDGFGIEADRFEYTFTFDSNYTWSRGEVSGKEHRWGRSQDAAGTPGEANEVLFEPSGSDLLVRVDPVHVSPDGDGFEDYTTITILPPLADDYTVKIYDRQGRVVRTFYDRVPTMPDELTIHWDGLSDTGMRLAIGIYILHVEASGVASVKKPIVIAR